MRDDIRARLRSTFSSDNKMSWQTFTWLLLGAIALGALVGLLVAII